MRVDFPYPAGAEASTRRLRCAAVRSGSRRVRGTTPGRTTGGSSVDSGAGRRASDDTALAIALSSARRPTPSGVHGEIADTTQPMQRRARPQRCLGKVDPHRARGYLGDGSGLSAKTTRNLAGKSAMPASARRQDRRARSLWSGGCGWTRPGPHDLETWLRRRRFGGRDHVPKRVPESADLTRRCRLSRIEHGSTEPK